MKIAIYANIDGTMRCGGIQTYLGCLIKALGQLDDGPERYSILCSASNSDWLEGLRGPNQELVRITHRPPGIGRKVLNRLGRAARWMARTAGQIPSFRSMQIAHARRQPNEVAADSVLLSTGLIESLGAAVVHFPFQQYIVTRLPSVFNPHDLQHLHLPQFFSPEQQLRREASYRLACQLATRIAVASDWIADDICEQYSLPRRKLAVIPWGAATAAHFKPTELDVERVRREYRLPDRFIFYPAAQWPHKNHSRLIAAVSEVRRRGTPIALILSGAGLELNQKLNEQVKALQLDQLVRMVGVVPAESMRALYRAAMAVVVPTLFEAMSGPVSEAWQEGVPVACSDIPQLRAQAAGAAMFFDPYSVDSIAESIQTVCMSASLREHLVSKGQEKIANLNWHTTAKRYRDLYREASGDTADRSKLLLRGLNGRASHS